MKNICSILFLLLLSSCSTKKVSLFTFSCFDNNGFLTASGTNEGIEIYKENTYHLCTLNEVRK